MRRRIADSDRSLTGRLIRDHRRAIEGMTQKALARATGVSDSHIAQIETGERNPSIDTLDKIVAALNLTAADRAALVASLPDERPLNFEERLTALEKAFGDLVEQIRFRGSAQ